MPGFSSKLASVGSKNIEKLTDFQPQNIKIETKSQSIPQQSPVMSIS